MGYFLKMRKSEKHNSEIRRSKGPGVVYFGPKKCNISPKLENFLTSIVNELFSEEATIYNIQKL